MPAFREKRVLPYPLGFLFELVLDVERYPEFLPWCRAARILSREDDGSFTAELIIHFNAFSESYVSKVMPVGPVAGKGGIEVTLVRGPFNYLTNSWHFEAIDDNTTAVECFVDFQFKSKLLEKFIGGLFEKVSRRMVGAFEERAHKLCCPVT